METDEVRRRLEVWATGGTRNSQSFYTAVDKHQRDGALKMLELVWPVIASIDGHYEACTLDVCPICLACWQLVRKLA